MSCETDSENQIMLAIETAFAGGSLALFRNGIEIGSWLGNEEVSKAEDVLEQIAELLKKKGIKKTQLHSIRVANGPGSATGTKIGLSIAKGLANALEIRVVEVSAATALLAEANLAGKGKILIVLPAGKNFVLPQIYEMTENTEILNLRAFSAEIRAMSGEQFQAYLNSVDEIEQIIFLRKAFEVCEKAVVSKQEISKISKIAPHNLAILIGKLKCV